MTALYKAISQGFDGQAAALRPRDFARVHPSELTRAAAVPAGAIVDAGSPEPWLDWMVR